MKERRQAAILDLISRGEISSQAELRNVLGQKGFSVTQATLSRDLKELNVVKVATPEGEYKYTVMGEPLGPLVSCEVSGNLIVLRTPPGIASAVALRVDSLHRPWLLGSVAGDDTLLVVIAEGYDGKKVKEELLNGVLKQ